MKDKAFEEKNELFKKCSICSAPRQNMWTVVIGDNACICPSCIMGAHQTLVQNGNVETSFSYENENKIYKSAISIFIAICIFIIVMTIIIFNFNK